MLALDFIWQMKTNPPFWPKHSPNIVFHFTLNQVFCFVGGVPKFLSVLMMLEAMTVKFQSVIPVLR